MSTIQNASMDIRSARLWTRYPLNAESRQERSTGIGPQMADKVERRWTRPVVKAIRTSFSCLGRHDRDAAPQRCSRRSRAAARAGCHLRSAPRHQAPLAQRGIDHRGAPAVLLRQQLERSRPGVADVLDAIGSPDQEPRRDVRPRPGPHQLGSTATAPPWRYHRPSELARSGRRSGQSAEHQLRAGTTSVSAGIRNPISS